MLNGLDLFSGIGGIAFALGPWVRTVAYCEVDRYCQAVLFSRMADGQLDIAPVWDDVRTLGASDLGEPVDIITGGFPCQDISLAGHGAGLDGERSGLWFQVHRLVAALRPAFVFLENVPAITVRGADRVTAGLAALGYDCRWDMLSAYDVGAPHRRERWWLLAADTKRFGLWDEPRGGGGAGGTGECVARNDGEAEPLADADRVRELQPGGRIEYERRRAGDGGAEMADAEGVRWRQGRPKSTREQGGFEPASGRSAMADASGLGLQAGRAGRQTGEARGAEFNGPSWWLAEPDILRVVNGLPLRVDRIKSLGNSVVPQCAREAFQRLMGIKKR